MWRVFHKNDPSTFPFFGKCLNSNRISSDWMHQRKTTIRLLFELVKFWCHKQKIGSGKDCNRISKKFFSYQAGFECCTVYNTFNVAYSISKRYHRDIEDNILLIFMLSTCLLATIMSTFEITTQLQIFLIYWLIYKKCLKIKCSHENSHVIRRHQCNVIDTQYSQSRNKKKNYNRSNCTTHKYNARRAWK